MSDKNFNEKFDTLNDASSDEQLISNFDNAMKKESKIKVLVLIDEPPSWESGIEKDIWDFEKTLFRRILHIGPLAAIFIILTIGLTTVILHVEFWPITTLGGCLDLLIFITWNYHVLSNLLLAAFYGGGYIPLNWKISENSVKGKLQYCNKCVGFKAPRSHHCRKCNRCVMKMDHHCPWINNCVGHRNQVFFMRFLFFAIIGCLHAVYIVGCCIWNTLKVIYFLDFNVDENMFVITSIYLFFAAILTISFALGVVVALTFLFFVQFKIALRNKTGIEEYICAKAAYRNGPSGFVYPYNLGWKRNLSEVFNNGKFIPKGNGVWWPIRSGCTQFTFSEEQLAQKKAKQEYLKYRFERGYVEEIPRWKMYYYSIVDFVLCRD